MIKMLPCRHRAVVGRGRQCLRHMLGHATQGQYTATTNAYGRGIVGAAVEGHC
jgi:hypothetical protein